jgi:hypothetical protein
MLKRTLIALGAGCCLVLIVAAVTRLVGAAWPLFAGLNAAVVLVLLISTWSSLSASGASRPAKAGDMADDRWPPVLDEQRLAVVSHVRRTGGGGSRRDDAWRSLLLLAAAVAPAAAAVLCLVLYA